MKRMVLSIGLVLASLLGIGQDDYVNYGGIYLKAGVNYSELTASESANMRSEGGMMKFHLGVVADIPITERYMSFQPGIMLNGKGGRVRAFMPSKTDESANYYDVTVNPVYLEVPANIVVKIPGFQNTRWLIGGGAYAAMGLTGKVKGTRVEDGKGIDYKRNIIYQDGNPYENGFEDTDVFKLNRFEFGVNALLGIETENFMITANFSQGLSRVNMYQADSKDANANRIISLSFGYKFGHNGY